MTMIDRSKIRFGSKGMFRIKFMISVLGALTLAGCVETSSAQFGPSKSLVYPVQGQQSVSKNQLLTPSKASKATDRAREDFMRGNFESAQKEIDLALKIAPDCAIALATQGALDFQAGRSDRAASFFQRAINNDPSLGAAYVGLGVILLSQNRFKEALIPLDRAAGLVPGSWYIQFETGLAQLGRGNSEAALEQVKFAARLANGVPERESGVSYLHALVLLQTNDVAVARQYLVNAITRDPKGAYAVAAARALGSTAAPAMDPSIESKLTARMSKPGDFKP